MKYPVISLFSGAMGLDLGLESAGLDIALSQDIDPWCIKTMQANGRQGMLGDIKKIVRDDPTASSLLKLAALKADQVFAVVGGPPCQAYSTAGKRLGTDDDRGGLFNEFACVVEAIRPRFFVMENVKGLLSMPASLDDPHSLPLMNTILNRFQSMGYSLVFGVVDAVNYGAPQFRERVIIMGSRDGEELYLPLASHFQKHQDPSRRWRTLRSAVENIGEIGPVAKFTPAVLKYLELVPEGGNWKSLAPDIQEAAMGGAYKSGGGKVGFYRRLNWNEPSPTLVTSPIQKATILCHPEQNRPLSVREYARLQGFPDDWKFEGDPSDCYRQIGNAVPLPLGRAIGQMLVSIVEDSATVKSKRVRGTSVHKKQSVMEQSQFVYEARKEYLLK